MSVQPNPAPLRRRLWPAAILAGLAVVVAVSIVLTWQRTMTGPRRPPGPEAPGGSAPPVGRPAPEFSLPLFDGGTLSLHSLKGKPVVLNFWASWCVPCREETPLLVRLHKVYGPRGVAFVGIDTEDEVASARRFISQHHVAYPLVRLDDERIIEAYAVPGLPTTVFIGADGTVVGKVVGGFVGPEGEKLLIARLNRLLSDTRR